VLDSVSWGVYDLCVSFKAVVAFGEAIEVVCVLGMALHTVSEVAAAGVAFVVKYDVMAGWWGLGLERRVCGLGWGVVALSGSVCHLLDGIGRRSRVLLTSFIMISSCDVAIARGGSVLERGGWGLSWGVVGQPGDQCRHS
jgi:hypothetical protein